MRMWGAEMKTSNFSYLIGKGISSVWKNFIMSFASFSILLVSLIQISCSVLLVMNVNIIIKNIEDTNELIIYVREDATEEQVEHIRQILENNSDIADIQYKSKDNALAEFIDAMCKDGNEDRDELEELFAALDENPMPEGFMASVTDISKIRYVAEAISSIEGVDRVNAPFKFAKALANIRNTFSVILAVMLSVLIIVSVVIVSNSIRTSVFARREEIDIMKYVGATRGFIKLPFFVEGMFIGLLSGAAAWGVTWFIYDSVYALFSSNLDTWQMFGFYGLIPFEDMRWFVLGGTLISGALLGALGTLIIMNKHLKEKKTA